MVILLFIVISLCFGEDYAQGLVCSYDNVLTDASGIISTHNFNISSRYPDNIKCSVAIRVQTSNVIRLFFRLFDIEEHNACAKDYLAVLDSNGELLGKYCNPDTPGLVISSSNILTLVFRTDNQNGGDGIEIQYDSFPKNSKCAIIGDPRGYPQQAPDAAMYNLMIFTSMKIPFDGYLEYFEYYGLQAGIAYLSFWQMIDGVNKYRMRSKVHFPIQPGLRLMTVAEHSPFLKKGDLVGIHHPTSDRGSIAFIHSLDNWELLKGLSATTELGRADTDNTAYGLDDGSWTDRKEIQISQTMTDAHIGVGLRIFMHCECDGDDCVSGCSPHCKDGSCNLNNGNCANGCVNGRYGGKCELDCMPGLYGENCSKACGLCKNNDVCHPVTGHCSKGCSDGLEPPKCDEVSSYALNILGIILVIICGVEFFVILITLIPVCRGRKRDLRERHRQYTQRSYLQQQQQQQQQPYPNVNVIQQTFEPQIFGSVATFQQTHHQNNRQVANNSDQLERASDTTDTGSHMYMELNPKTVSNSMKSKTARRQNSYLTRN